MNPTIDIPSETQALTRRESSAIGEALGVHEILAQVRLIQSVMREVMHDGEHFGTIPGCGDKKTLLQPGAQKLTMTFRLAPEYQVQETPLERGHKEYRVICTLKSIQSQTPVGQGVGCCSTMEGKYRFRSGNLKCPNCGKETVFKSKNPGEGFYCWAKKGGCGEKFPADAPAIKGQDVGRVEHDNPADFFNTVLKMAKKRAFVDATITATAASDIFTQDIGDEEAEPGTAPAPERQTSPPPKPIHTPAPKTPRIANGGGAKPIPASREERIKGLESWLGDKKEWAVAFLRNFTVDGSDTNSALMPNEGLDGVNDSALDLIKANPKGFLACLDIFIAENGTASDLSPVVGGQTQGVAPAGSAPQPPQPAATKWRHECPKCTSTSIATQGQTENDHNLSLARCELCGWQWKLSDGSQWEAHDWMRVIVPVPPKGVQGDAAKAYKQNPDTFGQLIRTDNRRAYGFAKNFKAELWQGRISPADQAFEKACRDAEAYFDSGEDKDVPQ